MNEQHYTEKRLRRQKIIGREIPEEHMYDRRKRKNYRYRTSNTIEKDRNLEME